MTKENMTSNQIISILILFIFGSSVIIGVSTEVKQDSWISLIMAIVIALPIVLIYARIIKLYPGLGLFDIIDKLFGKIFGKIIIILMSWYAIHLGAMVVKNFSEYIEITTLPKTPQLIVEILILLVAIYIAKSGPAILGSWAIIVLPIVILMAIITIIFSIGIIDIGNIFPIMDHSVKKITVEAYKVVSFPFIETVLLLPLASFFKKTDNPYKIYSLGLVLGAMVLLFLFLRNITILGTEMMYNSYFPSFTATRLIELKNYLTRIEGVITINYIFAGITKITICLIAASFGIAKLFSIKDYKKLAMPVGISILALSAILYANVMEMFDFINFYSIYTFPFQIVIPLLVWIMAEIKVRKKIKLV